MKKWTTLPDQTPIIESGKTKQCMGEHVPWERKPSARQASVMTPEVIEFIKSCLEENANNPKGQKHTVERSGIGFLKISMEVDLYCPKNLDVIFAVKK